MSTQHAAKAEETPRAEHDAVEFLPAANEQSDHDTALEPVSESQSQRHSNDLSTRTSRLEILGEALGSVAMKLGQSLKRVSDRTTVLEDRSGALDQRVGHSEKLLEAMENDIQAHSHELDSLEISTGQLREQGDEAGRRIDALRKTADLLADIDRRQGEQIGSLEERLDALEPAHDALEIAHQRLLESHEELTGSHQALAASHEALTAYAEATEERHQRLDEQVGHYGFVGGLVAGIVALGLVVAYALNTKLDVDTTTRLETQQVALGQTENTLRQDLATTEANLQQDVALVEQDVRDLGTQFEGDLSFIKDRIYASDAALAGASVDMKTIHDENWLTSLDPSHYTIQLLGSYNKRGLADFIGRHQGALDTDQLVYFQTTHHGRDWFVLVYGDFARYDQAMQTVENLPQEVLRTSPYIRSVSGTIESAQRD